MLAWAPLLVKWWENNQITADNLKGEIRKYNRISQITRSIVIKMVYLLIEEEIKFS